MSIFAYFPYFVGEWVQVWRDCVVEQAVIITRNIQNIVQKISIFTLYLGIQPTDPPPHQAQTSGPICSSFESIIPHIINQVHVKNNNKVTSRRHVIRYSQNQGFLLLGLLTGQFCCLSNIKLIALIFFKLSDGQENLHIVSLMTKPQYLQWGE